MKLLIKNMVCRHCVEAVRRILNSFESLHPEDVGLGYALLRDEPDARLLGLIDNKFREEGFELIKSRESAMVEEIKKQLIDRVRNPERFAKINVSRQLSEALGASYSVVSRLFSEVEGRTIENYLKSLRVERVKELIKYERLSFAEIADAAGYSSEAHMSRSFKQVTGMTPGAFRTLGSRTPLPEV